MQGAVNGIEDDRVGRGIAGKPLFERRALFGDAAHKREVLQHDREEDVLHGRVEYREGRGGVLRLATGEALVRGLANVGNLAVENQRGAGTLTDDRE